MRRACIFLMLLTLLPLCAGCAAADEGAGTQLIALNIARPTACCCKRRVKPT